MQGQILDAAVTSNRGLILGDDGARYTFTPDGWRDNSVKAVTGMRVEFNPQGAVAMDVSVIQGAPQPAPAPPPPFQASDYPAPSQPPPQPAQLQVSQAPYRSQSSQPPPQRPAFTVPATSVRPRPPTNFVPRYPQAKVSKVNMALLMIFLGPLGHWIYTFMIGGYPGPVIIMAIFTALIVISFWVSYAIQVLFAPFGIMIGIGYFCSIIGGIHALAISEESWNRDMHFQHDHSRGFFCGKREAEYCRTGVCRPDGPGDSFM